MRYDEIRQHVTAHFQEQLTRFKAGVMDSGPPSEGRAVMMRNIRTMMAPGWQDHAGRIGEEQAAKQVKAFCEHRGIDPNNLAPAVRQGLNEALVRGVDAYWRDAISFLEGLGEFDLDTLPLPASPAPAPAPITTPGPHPGAYQDVVDQYFTEIRHSAQVREKTADSKREALALLGEITEALLQNSPFEVSSPYPANLMPRA